MPPAGFEHTILASKQAGADSRLRPHGHLDRQFSKIMALKYETTAKATRLAEYWGGFVKLLLQW